MNQATVDLLTQVLTVVAPAVVTFLVGHYHLVLPNPLSKPVAPPLPVVPTNPALLPIGQGGILQALGLLQKALPTVDPNQQVAAVGQGGLLQIVSLAVQAILAHPTASVSDKAAAASQLVTVIAPFATPTK